MQSVFESLCGMMNFPKPNSSTQMSSHNFIYVHVLAPTLYMAQLFRHVLISSKFPSKGLFMTILGSIPKTLIVFQVYFMKTKHPTNPLPTPLKLMQKHGH
jgi:hypothetical protein